MSPENGSPIHGWSFGSILRPFRHAAWRLSLALGLALAVLAWTPGALADRSMSSVKAPVGAARVDPRASADVTAGQHARVLILLADQADTRAIVAREMAQAASRARLGQAVVDELRARATQDQPAIVTLLDAAGAPHRDYWVASVIAAEVDEPTLRQLATRPEVALIESDRTFVAGLEPLEQPTTLDQRSAAAAAVEPGQTRVGAPALWALGFRGQGITYANADTGVSWDHPALKTHYRGWQAGAGGGTATHDHNWWDAIHENIANSQTGSCGLSSAIPCDDHGHGTHTMGIGVGDDGAGNQIGTAPGSRWIACRNMDRGVGRPSTYIECLQFFLAPTDLKGQNADPGLRPDVISNSYGCPPSELCSAESLRAAVESVRTAGIFFAVSAGNAGPDCSTVQDPPALYESSFTVGATGSQTDQIAGFSSRGPVTLAPSTHLAPLLVAPGVSIRSSILGGGYGYMSGTSMAAPVVAGGVALLWSAVPSLRNNVPTTISLIERSAAPLYSTQSCGADSPTQRPNNEYGYGRLDLLAAYKLAASRLVYVPLVTREGAGK